MGYGGVDEDFEEVVDAKKNHRMHVPESLLAMHD